MQTLKKQALIVNTNKTLLLVFTSAKKIQELNKSFLNKNVVTDILSFDAIDKSSFGELVLCREKICTQARQHAISQKQETAYLILHGILHLLGYHHEKDAQEARKMYKIQDDIFYSWTIKQLTNKKS